MVPIPGSDTLRILPQRPRQKNHFRECQGCIRNQNLVFPQCFAGFRLRIRCRVLAATHPTFDFVGVEKQFSFEPVDRLRKIARPFASLGKPSAERRFADTENGD
jgi:hypothetical protein